MSRPASERFDWRGWRDDVAERLDRRSIGVALAWVAVFAALNLAGPNNAATVANYTLFKFGTVMVTLAILAVALVAVVRGVSAWLAYPLAALAAVAIGSVLGVMLDPWGWLAATPPPPVRAVVVGHLYSFSILGPFAVLYVYASRATHDAKVLRALEAERAAEAERLAQQRLHTELATVDHDLVLRAMRLALDAREHAGVPAESLLDAATSYLRAAQQRGTSEPQGVKAARRQLEEACAGAGGEPAHA